MRCFHMDQRLADDTLPIATLGLCELRLMNDSRWPWTILVPKRDDIAEFHDMTPLDQTMLTFETTLVSKALKRALKAEKMNVAMLGNIVSMLHVHVIARYTGDTHWPNPVWGFGTRVPYEADAAQTLIDTIKNAVLSA